MNDVREKIAETISSTLEFDGVIYNSDETIDAILSALPDIIEGMIPDLEFVGNKAGDLHSTMNMYEIVVFPSFFEVMQRRVLIDRVVGSIGDAIDIANEHHKSQIMKAIGVEK